MGIKDWVGFAKKQVFAWGCIILNYRRIYEQLIDAARRRDLLDPCSELHHIKPRSLGGSDDPWNLVRLTYREHFLAHWVLTKICEGADLVKMQVALMAMTLCADNTRLVAGWQYEVAKFAVYRAYISQRALADKIVKERYQDNKDRTTVLARDQLELDRISVIGDLAEVRLLPKPSQGEVLARLSSNWLGANDPEKINKRRKPLTAARTRPLRDLKEGMGRYERQLLAQKLLVGVPVSEPPLDWLNRVGTPPPVKLFGRIVFFNHLRGYGFVRPDDGSQDLFLSIKTLPKGSPIPKDDQRCAYVPVTGKKGPVVKEFVLL